MENLLMFNDGIISPALSSTAYLPPRPQAGLQERQTEVFVSLCNTFQVAFFVGLRMNLQCRLDSFSIVCLNRCYSLEILCLEGKKVARETKGGRNCGMK